MCGPDALDGDGGRTTGVGWTAACAVTRRDASRRGVARERGKARHNTESKARDDVACVSGLSLLVCACLAITESHKVLHFNSINTVPVFSSHAGAASIVDLALLCARHDGILETCLAPRNTFAMIQNPIHVH